MHVRITESRVSRPAASRRLFLEPLEPRTLLAAFFGEPLPTKVGETLVINDWDYTFRQSQLGQNYLSGATGLNPGNPGLMSTAWSSASQGAAGGSLRLSFDFTGQPPAVFYTAYAESLQGPLGNAAYSFNLNNLFDSFGRAPQSAEQLRLDVLRQSAAPITLRVELMDAGGRQMFARVGLTAPVGEWQAINLALASDFTPNQPAAFDPTQAKVVSLVVERANPGAGLNNPDQGAFLIDNLRLVDTNGVYPQLSAALSPAGAVVPEYEAAFLNELRRQAAQYFVDWAATQPQAGGLVQDRSTFTDLLTTGGAGFQLTNYVLSAERNYLPRSEAAQRTVQALRVLFNQPQGPAAGGVIGHQGFFYHFLGGDGLRKQNSDFPETPQNEALNTIELSTIDTTLAVWGALTAAQYFTQPTAVEQEIRTLAESIYARVNWRFMLQSNPSAPGFNQFLLGWKPNELRDDQAAPFLWPDALGQGKYASRGPASMPQPATLDYYTDEALLTVLLAMAAPNPAFRVGAEAWYALQRAAQSSNFVKTFPGSLFTYQFAGLWLDTEGLGTDNHPATPVNFFANTAAATVATREYAIGNPQGRATLNGRLWALTATEGPHGDYRAYAAGTVGLASTETLTPSAAFWEAESASGAVTRLRSNASNAQTAFLPAGGMLSYPLNLPRQDRVTFRLGYSNDNGGPLETITLLVDGVAAGSLVTEDTGDGGNGWNQFASAAFAPVVLPAGAHTLTLVVTGGDGFGVELDTLSAGGEATSIPREDGTVAPYGAALALDVAPGQAVDGLAEMALRLNPGARAAPGLYHPRSGLPDALNLDVADVLRGNLTNAAALGAVRSSGPYATYVQQAINAGPLAIAIDNYLSQGFIPRLLASRSDLAAALAQVFPNRASPWHNRDNPFDVNRDRYVTGLDAVIVVNHLGAAPPNQPLSAVRPLTDYEVDVNRDRYATGLDAVLVVVEIHRVLSGGDGESSAADRDRAAAGAPSIDDELLTWLALSLGEERRRQDER